MAEDINNNFLFFVAKQNQGAVESLGGQSAKKYLHNLEVDDVDEETYPFSLTEVVSLLRTKKNS